MIAKTVVLNTVNIYDYSKVMGKKETSLGLRFKFARSIGYIFVIIFIGMSLYLLYPAIVLAIIYSSMYYSQSSKYDESFYKKFPEKDFNNSRIHFYKNELEKSSKYLVNAEGLVEIFEYDTKVELSLECIQRYLQENNESNWINESSYIRKNARNKFTTTDALVERAKNNEENMGQNFYLYEMNLVHEVSDEVTGSWRDSSKTSLCDQNLSANKLYDKFLTKYITNYTDKHLYSLMDNYDNKLNKHYKESEEW